VTGRRSWLRRRSLSAQLLVGHVVVLAVAGLLGFGLWARLVHGKLDQQYEQRALAIAAATGAMPQVVHALTVDDPAGIQALARRVQHDTGASYVVVINRDGIRYSHPDPAKIGQRIEEPVVALDGKGHLRIDPGSLGPSANGRAPVFGTDGRVVGEVSAGVPETTVSEAARGELVSLAIYLGVALMVGIVVATLLARRLKRQTFGLELAEIAALVQEREATLHGIREGVVAVGPDGRITLINDQAHRLLATLPSDLGKQVRDVLPAGELRDEVFLADSGSTELTDRLALHHGRVLVGSRRPVSEGRRNLGYVVTLRDRTDLEHALRELDETKSLTDALRAQQHEFANRMHVMSGLLELGRYDEAAGYATEIDRASAGLASALEAKISDARLVALLVAKTTVARERGVGLTVDCPSRVVIDEAVGDALITIIGNLVDNAIEAVAEAPRRRGVVPSVTVRLAVGDRDLAVEVSDTGPGIPPGTAETIFTGGWSTKQHEDGHARGIGLALVRQLVGELHGTVAAYEGTGARFEVVVPRAQVQPA
jgi:two-component system CitB family sensor kinase